MSEAEAWNGVMGGGNPAPSCAQAEVDAAKVGAVGGAIAAAAGAALTAGCIYGGHKIDQANRKG